MHGHLPQADQATIVGFCLYELYYSENNRLLCLQPRLTALRFG